MGGKGRAEGSRAPGRCGQVSRGASRAAPWAAAAFVARGLPGAAEPGGDLECHGLGEAREGPSLCPRPHPWRQVVGVVLSSTLPPAPPAPPCARTVGARTSWRSLASAVKGSLTLISSCLAGGPGPSSRRKGSFFFPGNKCLFSPVLTCSCTVVRCGAAW